MYNALDGDQAVGQGPQLMRLALQRDGLKAMMVVEMYVLNSQYQVVIAMLYISRFILQVTLMMIIYQHDGTRHLLVPAPAFLNLALADQVADGLRPVRELLLYNQIIQVIEIFLFQRNAKSF